MPSSALTPAIKDEIARLGSADIMVGIPSYRNAATIGYVVRAAQAGLVQYFPDLRPILVNADAGSPDGTQRVVVETEPPGYVEEILLVHPTNRLDRVSLTYPEVDGIGGKGAALRTLFEMAAALQVEALVVVDSDLRSIVPEWIELLAGPIMKGGYDYVTPLYAATSTTAPSPNTVTYPVTRALYGHRIRQPIGGDFGRERRPHPLLPRAGHLDARRFSLRHRYLDDDHGSDRRLRGLPDAARGQDPRSQGPRLRPGPDVPPGRRHPHDDGSRQCRPLAEHHRQPRRAGLRLRAVRGSGSARGQHAAPAGAIPLGLVDPRRHVGSDHPPDNCKQVLALAAEAGTLAEAAAHRLGLGRESGEGTADSMPSTDVLSDAVAAFHFPDDLWAHVFYDLLVSASFGDVELERLVAAFVPIYFGRVGSLVIEDRRLSEEQAEEHVERQAREFELRKPYLVERWREAAEAARGAGTAGTGTGTGTGDGVRTARRTGTAEGGESAETTQ